MIKVNTSLDKLNFIKPYFLKKLASLNIKTVGDLIYYFPTRYEDFSQIYKIADLAPGKVTIQAEISKLKNRAIWRRNLNITEAILKDDTGEIKAVWFNQPFLVSSLKVGKLANFSGKVVVKNDELELVQPSIESISKDELHNTARLIPIYPETKGITSKALRYFLSIILKNLEKLPEIIPPEILQSNNFLEINKAISQIHFPDNLNLAEIAKKRFAFEDLFIFQLSNLKQKLRLSQEKSFPLSIDLEELKRIVDSLPYQLTFSQKRSLWEIIQDLQKPKPMNRLLQGDVGSGKTVVAAIAALFAAKNGYQAAFLAPTEILARQHYETIKKLFSLFHQEIPTVLLTASFSKVFYDDALESDIKKNDLKNKILSGEIKIIIGTSSIIQKTVKFKNLALAIVDEQHRFGVNQRAQLSRGSPVKKGMVNLQPHFLSMSATPIPRTLNLVIFGDLDISIIDELPKNRLPIETKIVLPEERDSVYQFIKEKVKTGDQVFVVCPRIDNNPEEGKKNILNLEVKTVKEEFEKLSKKIFPELKVAMIHGRLKSKEKEKIMKEFAEKKIDILVSTSVIEVGIDIPNATIMMIEGAERFGLAQLYQLRGRIGRGNKKSYCFLFSATKGESVKSRLSALVKAKNGFELAEFDLRFRGPGEIFGLKQTGLPDIALNALANPEMVKISRQAALDLLKSDPSLNKHRQLKTAVSNFETAVHLE